MEQQTSFSKQIFSIMLSLIMVLSLLYLPSGIFCIDFGLKASAATIDAVAPTTGDGTAENPYQIGTAGELYWFAEKVNGGETAICAVLTADIVVNTGDVTNCGGAKQGDWIDWTPIAYGNSRKYSGTFDGQGHTVSGLYYKTTTNYAGLFGNVYDGSICNVGVVNSYIQGGNYVGGVCGRIYNSGSDTVLTISNCYNTGTVKGTTDSVGGVFGYVQNAGSAAVITVTNCCNSGNVYLTGTSTSGNAGGVCGYINNTGASAAVTLTKCYNTGNVDAAGSSSKRIGGVCGRCDKATISNCYNTGAVAANGTRSTDVGGVCGYLYATSSTAAKVINCYSIGTPSTPKNSQSNLGGVCGKNYNGTIENCYYLAETEDENSGKTTSQFASGEVAYLLQGTQTEVVWGQNIDNGKPTELYPALSGKKVYNAPVYEGCEGIPGESTGYKYSNKDAVYADHTDNDGDCICDNCGSIVESSMKVAATMVNGAALRLTNGNGLRFYTLVDSAKIAELQALGATVEL
ncbi:MAG: GLUG motif-containing protein, partial [Acutalibacteraceae bacterium]